MPHKALLALTFLCLSRAGSAADLSYDTDLDCARAVGVRCAMLRQNGLPTLLIWREEAPDEETRQAWNHERQMIERRFEADGGKSIVVREVNSRTGQLVERICTSDGCNAWSAIALPEVDSNPMWEQLTNDIGDAPE